MASLDKLIQSADKNLSKGNVKKAIKDYEEIISLKGDDSRHRQKLAELLNREGRGEEAIEQFTKAAELYEKSGFEAKAVAVLKQAQRIDTSVYATYYRLAELNIKLGLAGNAISEFNALIKVAEKKKDRHEIITVREKLLEADPANLTRAKELIESYLAEGLREKGGKAIHRVVQMYRDRQDYVKACKIFELFFPQYPNDVLMKVVFAEVLVEMGEQEKGLALLRNLLKEDPDNTKILNAQVRSFRVAKDFPAERATLNHLLKLEPENLDYRREFIRACADEGEKKRGLEAVANWEKDFTAFGRGEELRPLRKRLEELSETAPEEVPQPDEGFGDLDLTGFGEEAAAPPAAAELPPSAPAAPAPATVKPAAPVTPAPAVTPAAAPAPPPPPAAKVITIDLLLTDPPGELLCAPAPPAPPAKELLEAVQAQEDAASPDPFAEPEQVQPPLSQPEPEEPAVEEEVLEEFDDLELLEDLELLAEDVEEPSSPEPLEPLDVLEDLELIDDLELVEDDLELLEEDDEILDIGLEMQLTDAQVAHFELERELDEARFYLQQELFDEADDICRRLMLSHPGSSDVASVQREIGERRGKAASAPKDQGGFFDLTAAIFDEELGSAFDALAKEEEDIADTLAKFREGVAEQIGADDTESHYDLGIAYLEMGLYEDAFHEFEAAERSPVRFVDCQVLKASALNASGRFSDAARVLTEALTRPHNTEQQQQNLYYELGASHEGGGRFQEAYNAFMEASVLNPFFRDVKDRLGQLKGRLAGSGDDPSGKKDRVSYV